MRGAPRESLSLRPTIQEHNTTPGDDGPPSLQKTTNFIRYAARRNCRGGEQKSRATTLRSGKIHGHRLSRAGDRKEERGAGRKWGRRARVKLSASRECVRFSGRTPLLLITASVLEFKGMFSGLSFHSRDCSTYAPRAEDPYY